MSAEWSREELRLGANELGLSPERRRDLDAMARDDHPGDRSVLAAVGRLGRKVLQRKAQPRFLGSSNATGYHHPSRDPLEDVRAVPPRPDMRGILFPDPPVLTEAERKERDHLLWPLKFQCNGCEKWHEVPTTVERLRTLRLAYLDMLQERAEEAWRLNPYVRLAAEREAQADAERRREAAEERARLDERQRRADARFMDLMANQGCTLREAAKIIAREFGSEHAPDWSW